jgi:methylmalonyl-CoA/ethylmalonyl-CoA epimerase
VRGEAEAIQRSASFPDVAPLDCFAAARNDGIRVGRQEKMIGRLNHVAIAVKDLDAATAVYRDTLGAKVTEPLPQPEHGVTVVFVELPNSKVELMSPLGENSTIQGFVDKNPAGGIHHVCYEVEDIIAARDQMKAAGARVLGTGEPKIGAHGKPVIFLHPKDFLGTLVELEQV